jgi:hypothetical protein
MGQELGGGQDRDRLRSQQPDQYDELQRGRGDR